MRHLALVSLLVFTMTFSAGCALNRPGSQSVATLRRETAAQLKQLMERPPETDREQETFSEVVQASFTEKTDEDFEAFLIETDEEPEQPEWWITAEAESRTDDRSFAETTLSANSNTDVTANKPAGSWKPAQGWTASKSR